MTSLFQRRSKRHGHPKRRLRQQPTVRRTPMTGFAGTPPATQFRVAMPKTVRVRRKRRQWASWKRWRTLLRQIVLSTRWVSLAIFLLSAYTLYFVGIDKNFHLHSIPIRGANFIPVEEILEASQLAGVHIFSASPDIAATHIVEDVPGIISATVTIQWSNRVEIAVMEDAPVAIWEQDEIQYWINKDGQLMPARTPLTSLLVIRSEMKSENTNESIATTDNTLEELPSNLPGFIASDVLAGALQLQEIMPDIDTLYYRPSGGLSYDDERGWRAYFGTNTDMPQKLVVYNTVVNKLLEGETTPVYISVSNQEKPYYRAR